MSLCPLAHGKIIYVDEDATGANDGTSWVNAYGHLQDALADANSSPKPVEIRVAQGVYRPDQGKNQALGDRRASFHLVDRASLKGGYAGWGQPDPNARNVLRQQSILSGDIGIPNAPEDNSYHVLVSQRLNAGATLDGFVISGGQADGSWPDDCGGGLWYDHADNLVLTDCTFTANSAKSWGGAIYKNGSDEDHEVTQCTFSGNAAKSGGAVYNDNVGGVFTDCTFRYNSAAADGGGMCNTAHNEGGCCPTLTNCLFIGCVAGNRGGGVCNLGGEEEWVVPMLIGCEFSHNRARLGGGVYSFSTWYGPVFDHCRFAANRATHSGGAMYNAADDGEPCYATLTNCLVVGNVAKEAGGAIRNDLARPTLTNCTLAANAAPEGAALLSHFWAVTRLTNCILWNGGSEVGGTDASRVTATYSNVRGGWPGEGNIDADPCFVAPGHWERNGTPDDPNDDAWVDGDYHLLPNSPCIDAGDPNLVADPNKPESDIYGGPRFTGARIDIGADEYSKYDGGTGEPNDPYQIWSAEQMNAIGAEPNDWDKCFRLMADIDLSAFDGKDARRAFNTIAPDWETPFTGVFDGNGHTILNFRYTSANGSCAGLFGYVEGPDAQIRNVGLIDPNVAGGLYVGSLVGRLNEGAVTCCYVSGARVIGDESVGGLVGKSFQGVITNCHAEGTVEGRECVGGLLGGNDEATIVNSHATGVVKGTLGGAGGLVGANADSTIQDCYAVCTVSGDKEVGGLAGENGWHGMIMGCYAKGTVSGKVWVGGLVGLSEGNDTIVDCYSTAEAIGDQYVGGLVGEKGGTIRNCYSTGRVTARLEWGGGLVGFGWPRLVTGCFWDTETSALTTSPAGTGKTTAEMQTSSTFVDAGWDFVGETGNGTEDIWLICEGVAYPHLAWEFVIGDFDADADTDFADFCILAEHWLAADGSFWCGQGCDLTNDGSVNWQDLIIFAEKWLTGIAP